MFYNLSLKKKNSLIIIYLLKIKFNFIDKKKINKNYKKIFFYNLPLKKKNSLITTYISKI